MFEEIRNRLASYYSEKQTRYKYLAENSPQWREKTLLKAEQIMNGMLVLPGTNNQPWFVGNPPKWFENPTDNVEFVWALSRHLCWKDLVAAYHITGEKKYAEFVVGQMTEWVKSCPMPKLTEDEKEARERFYAVTPWRSLDAGVRMTISWFELVTGLIGTEFFTDDILNLFLNSVLDHARSLRYITPIFWPKADHNHYLHEMFGLLSACILLPETDETKEWQKFSIEQLERCLKAQFAPEGGQIEGSPGYHDVCLRMVYECMSRAKEANITLPPVFEAVVTKSAEYSAFTVKPDGSRAALGDTDLDITAIPRIIALHYGNFGDLGVFENIIGLLDKEKYEKTLFEYALLFGDVSEFKNALENAKSSEKEEYNYQKTIDQFFYRSGWGKGDDYLLFSCHTPVTNGHAHIDPMTFDLSLKGNSVVIDPGRNTYAENQVRRTFKSPEYHSTLLIGDKHPFEYVSTWEYTPQKEGHISEVSENGRAVLAYHKNYEPAVHCRTITMEDGSATVTDDVFDPEFNEVTLYYHLGGKQVEIYGNQVEITDQNVKITFSSNPEITLLDGMAAPISDFTVPTKRIKVKYGKPDSENTRYITRFSAE